MTWSLFGTKCGVCGKRTRDALLTPAEAGAGPQTMVCGACSARLKSEAEARVEAERRQAEEARKRAEAAARAEAERRQAEEARKRDQARQRSSPQHGNSTDARRIDDDCINEHDLVLVRKIAASQNWDLIARIKDERALAILARRLNGHFIVDYGTFYAEIVEKVEDPQVLSDIAKYAIQRYADQAVKRLHDASLLKDVIRFGIHGDIRWEAAKAIHGLPSEADFLVGLALTDSDKRIRAFGIEACDDDTILHKVVTNDIEYENVSYALKKIREEESLLAVAKMARHFGIRRQAMGQIAALHGVDSLRNSTLNLKDPAFILTLLLMSQTADEVVSIVSHCELSELDLLNTPYGHEIGRDAELYRRGATQSIYVEDIVYAIYLIGEKFRTSSPDIVARIAQSAASPAIRHEFIDEVWDDRHLLRIAQNDPNEELRMLAASRMRDQSLYMEMTLPYVRKSLSDANPQVRKSAILKYDVPQDELIRICDTDPDAQVTKAAWENIESENERRRHSPHSGKSGTKSETELTRLFETVTGRGASFDQRLAAIGEIDDPKLLSAISQVEIPVTRNKERQREKIRTALEGRAHTLRNQDDPVAVRLAALARPLTDEYLYKVALSDDSHIVRVATVWKISNTKVLQALVVGHRGPVFWNLTTGTLVANTSESAADKLKAWHPGRSRFLSKSRSGDAHPKVVQAVRNRMGV